jgi:uncharacterized membrane protein YeaQ/YmgE (transglycosylase-associated protein family)
MFTGFFQLSEAYYNYQPNLRRSDMDALGIIGWIVLGGLAGWVASMIVGNDKSQGLLGNIVVGIVGGLLGGFIFGLLGGEGVTGFNIWSFLVALVGAVILLFLWRALTGARQKV